jgi:hypothetical protein
MKFNIVTVYTSPEASNDLSGMLLVLWRVIYAVDDGMPAASRAANFLGFIEVSLTGKLFHKVIH